VEGVETALSVRDALPEYKIVATSQLHVCMMFPYPLKPKEWLFARMKTALNASSNKSVADAVNTYLAKGLQVEVAYPRALAGLDKTDFNDLSRAMGVQAVREDFEKTIRIQSNKPLSVSELLDLKNDLQKTKNTLSQPHYQSQQKELER
jgi:hypothetical protein